jgi:ABC-type transport system substrate-binding protein
MAVTYLKRIGVDATSLPTEWPTMTADIKGGNTEMFIMGGGSVMGGMNMLFNSKMNPATAHNTFFADPELDKMLDDGYATVKTEERIEKLKAAALRALDNKTHAGGYFEYVQIGMNNRVKDFEKSPTLWYGLTTPFRNVSVE